MQLLAYTLPQDSFYLEIQLEECKRAYLRNSSTSETPEAMQLSIWYSVPIGHFDL